MKKRIFTLFLAITIMISLTGCTQTVKTTEEQKQSSQSTAITFVDDSGRSIKLEKPLEKVVVFNAMNTEIIRALGKIDTVVGIDANTAQNKGYWNKLNLNAIAGKSQTLLDYEVIAQMKPDAVILPSNGSWEEADKKLTPFGIKVIVATGWQNVGFEKQVKILATAFGVEKKGEEYIKFCDKPLEDIKAKLATIPKEKRKTVYFENAGNYKTCLVGSGWNDMIISGGGINLFGDIVFSDKNSAKGSVHSFDVDPEQILTRNPDVILMNVYSTAANPGTSIYLKMDKKEIPSVLASLGDRPGWKDLTAVKNNQVYGFSAFTGNSCFKIVASCYIAKWLYPDVFKELDPDAFYNEWLTKYQGVAALGDGQISKIQ